MGILGLEDEIYENVASTKHEAMVISGGNPLALLEPIPEEFLRGGN